MIASRVVAAVHGAVTMYVEARGTAYDMRFWGINCPGIR